MEAQPTEPQGWQKPYCRESLIDSALLAGMRAELRAYLAEHGVPTYIVADVVLSVHEAATNAIECGSDDGVELKVWVAAAAVHVRVSDRGPGFTVRPPRRRSVWRTRGRGLYLMRSLMDELAIECCDGTVLRMSKGFFQRAA